MIQFPKIVHFEQTVHYRYFDCKVAGYYIRFVLN